MRARPDRGLCERLIGLIYELLEAHDDTARIARAAASDPAWEPHLVYLCDLQRLGREVLAAAAGELEAGCAGLGSQDRSSRPRAVPPAAPTTPRNIPAKTSSWTGENRCQ